MRATSQLWTAEDLVPTSINLMDQMVAWSNIEKAARRVISNKGSAGVDKMEVGSLLPWLQSNYWMLCERLLKGDYAPKPVRSVEIEKPGGGKRQLGIPTVIDRMLQQALHQVLNPFFEPFFSEQSFGYRAGRNAQQAVVEARDYQRQGKRWVIDFDLSNFFNEVNHDLIMSRIKSRVADVRVLKLIDKYLRSGIMTGGVISPRSKGTPQGSPLSPLLSNILLDKLDKELERRGHSFCRYADDFSIYVKSEKAGHRVYQSITHFIERKLKLKVNHKKSKVDKGYRRLFLGYGFTSERLTRLRVSEESVRRFRYKAKVLFRQGRGMNIQRFIRYRLNPLIEGWCNYFKLAETKTFADKLDKWIRRRLRLIKWRQWKSPRTRFRNIKKAGLTSEFAVMAAYNNRGCWWNSNYRSVKLAIPNQYFEDIGLLSMVALFGKLLT